MAEKETKTSTRPGTLAAQLPGLKPETLSQSKRNKVRVRTKAILVQNDDGDGNWLVSYADMMTLLVGFFVMISAFSTPNAAKFEEMKQRTAKAMGAKYTKPYQELSTSLKEMLKEFQLDRDITVDETLEGVTITSKGTLFFDSGSAELKEQARQVMIQLADILMLKAKGFQVVVEGHTDDVPIVSKQFPSNWELSSSRAGTVIRLLESKGFSRENLRPIGLADIEPIVPNRTAAGEPIAANQAENRRIMIRIERQLPRRTSK